MDARSLAELQVKQVQVAPPLAILGLGAWIRTRVNDIELGPGDGAAGAANCGKNLFVNPALESEVRAIPEELDVVDDRHVPIRLAFNIFRRGSALA